MMYRLLLICIGVLAVGEALPQRPPYQPGPWVYPLPTTEFPIPTSPRPAEVSNVAPQKPKPAIENEAAAAVIETTSEQAAEKEQQENLDNPQVTPEAAPATTTIAPAEVQSSSQRYDILGVAIAPAVIDRKKFRPIKDVLYW